MADHVDGQGPADDLTRRINARRTAAGEKGADFPSLAYHQLKQLAHRQLRRESGEPTLSTTALVHEAWIQLSDNGAWQDRGHFYRYAATAMRHILVDQARRRLAEKRGGGAICVDLATCDAHVSSAGEDILSIDHALEDLARKKPQLAEVVELRFFAGLSVAESAQALGISERSVVRNWRMARAMIHCALETQQMA